LKGTFLFREARLSILKGSIIVMVAGLLVFMFAL